MESVKVVSRYLGQHNLYAGNSFDKRHYAGIANEILVKKIPQNSLLSFQRYALTNAPRTQIYIYPFRCPTAGWFHLQKKGSLSSHTIHRI